VSFSEGEGAADVASAGSEYDGWREAGREEEDEKEAEKEEEEEG
jgi:hypothetical protein